jgi:hypothetical protein
VTDLEVLQAPATEADRGACGQGHERDG